jgi:type I restriction enzyme S subunit
MVDQATTIPKGWKMTTLGEVAEKIIDNRGKTPPIVNSGFELLEVNAISENQRTPDYSRVTKFVEEETFNNWFRTGNILENDILIPTVGTIGNVSFSKLSRGAIAQNLIAFRTDKSKAEPLLVYYLLKTSYYKNQLLKLDIGGVQPSIKVPHLLGLEINLPTLPEQRAIAAVLSSLDDKIEFLQEHNKTLEATAQTIFKEWFVKFKVKSEKLKVNSSTGLPEGWRMGRIKDCGEIICGKTPPKEIKEYFGGSIPFIKIPDMHNEMFIVKTEDSLTEEGADFQRNKFIPKNSICVSCIATVGLVSITGQRSQTNQQINTIVPAKDEYLEYLYYVLKNMTDDLLAIGSGGSATLNINTGVFLDIEIVLPSDDILKAYHSVTEPLFLKVLSNLSQIQTLSKLRDALLPKLMKGEVRVKGFNN